MDDNHLQNLLTLYFAPGLGLATITKLNTYFGSLENIIAADSATLAHVGLKERGIKAIKNPNQNDIDQAIIWSQQPNQQILTLDDATYPSLLKETAAPPLLLFVAGQTHWLSRPQIALVGSRNPTITGQEQARQFAFELSQAGLIVTSGLAIGIDTLSHQGAIAANKPTIAVLGSGIEQLYPRRNKKLAAKIRENGTIVSEFPLTYRPTPANFPRRNRIIAGLSLGTLVIEAAPKSGSLITAYIAAKENREVYAIPGPINNPLAQGCHQLLKDGAKLTQHSSDIIEDIPEDKLKKAEDSSNSTEVSANNNHRKNIKLDVDHQTLLDCVPFAVTSVNQLIAHTGCSAATISARLCYLEINGLIRKTQGGYIRA